eukprot:TRINITY_DN7160_c0_g1_i1.p1 TRINITY_DN7160_c0_g1~~TRINITY_DN7160_c0_g1_i1.p1  ORF type:complete len:1507 (+),score=307.56 TRINITY_DN7160_c0_g1_i1:33-4523(+)
MSLLGLSSESFRDPASMFSGGSPASVRFELRSRVSPTAAEPRTQSCSSQLSRVGRGYDDSVEHRHFSGALAAAGLSDESSSSSHARYRLDRQTDFGITDADQAAHRKDLLADGRTARSSESDWQSERLEALAKLRQRNFGTLRSSWLVKNSFSVWRSMVRAQIQAARLREKRAEELCAVWELQALLARREEEVQELSLELARCRRRGHRDIAVLDIDSQRRSLRERAFSAWCAVASNCRFVTQLQHVESKCSEHMKELKAEHLQQLAQIETTFAQMESELRFEHRNELDEMQGHCARLESDLKASELRQRITSEELNAMRLQADEDSRVGMDRVLKQTLFAAWKSARDQSLAERTLAEQRSQIALLQGEVNQLRSQISEESSKAELERQRLESSWRVRLEEVGLEFAGKLKRAEHEQQDLRKELEGDCRLKLRQQEEEFESQLRRQLAALESDWRRKLKEAEQAADARLRSELDNMERDWRERLQDREEELEVKLKSATHVWEIQLSKVHQEHQAALSAKDEEHEAVKRALQTQHLAANDVWEAQLQRVHQEHLEKHERSQNVFEAQLEQVHQQHKNAKLAWDEQIAQTNRGHQSRAQLLEEEHMARVQELERQQRENKERLLLSSIEALGGGNAKVLLTSTLTAWSRAVEKERHERLWASREQEWEQHRWRLENELRAKTQQTNAQKSRRTSATGAALEKQKYQVILERAWAVWSHAWETGCMARQHDRMLDSVRQEHDLRRLQFERDMQNERIRRRTDESTRAEKIMFGGGGRLDLRQQHALSQVLSAWLLVSMALHWERSKELAAGEAERLAMEVGRLEQLLLQEQADRGSDAEQTRLHLRDQRLMLRDRSAGYRTDVCRRNAMAKAFADWRLGLQHDRLESLATASKKVLQGLRTRGEQLVVQTFAATLRASSEKQVGLYFCVWKNRRALLKRGQACDAKLQALGHRFLRKTDSVLLHRVLTAWRLERTLSKDRHMFGKGMRRSAVRMAEKVLLLQAGPSAAFYFWLRFVSSSRSERTAGKAQGQAEFLRAKVRSRQDFIVLRWSEQSQARLGQWALRHWSEETAASRLERSNAHWRQKLKLCRHRGSLGGTRLASQLLVVRSRLLLFATLVSWRLKLSEENNAQRLSLAHSAVSRLKLRAAEVAFLAGSRPAVLMSQVLMLWRTATLQSHRGREQELRLQASLALTAQEEDHSRLRERLLMSNAFRRWRHWSASMAHSRAVEQLRSTARAGGPGRVVSVVGAIEERRWRLLCMEVFLRWGYAVRLQRPVPSAVSVPTKAAEVISRSYSWAPQQPSAIRSIVSPRYSISYVGPAAACPACNNVYMADSVFCRHCGRKRDAEAVVPITPRAANSASPQGSAQCLTCGNVFLADSVFCRKCGNKREELRLAVLATVPPLQQSQSNLHGHVATDMVLSQSNLHGHVATDMVLSPRTPVVSAGRPAEPLTWIASGESSPPSLRLDGLRLATRSGWLQSKNEARDASPMARKVLEMR